ncbi:MAG: hypothetical protein JW902_07440 [Syntrophaceae bacterium]|nr:hypothetical protein [Syntrophaceae bacterium]
MKTKLIFSNVLLLVMFLVGITFSEESLTGYWLSTQKSNGGMASILEFQNDGTVESYMSIMRDYKYQLKDHNLTLRPADEEQLSQVVFLINIKGDALTMKPSGETDAGVTLKRVGNREKSESKDIVGQWVYDDPSTKGKKDYYIFTPDGFMLYRLPMPGRTVSKFSIKGDTLEISREDMKPAISKWQIEDGILTLSSQDGKVWSYKRVPSEGLNSITNKSLHGSYP